MVVTGEGHVTVFPAAKIISLDVNRGLDNCQPHVTFYLYHSIYSLNDVCYAIYDESRSIYCL